MTHTVSLCPLCHEHPYPLPKLPYYAYCSDCKLAWLWRFPKAIYGDNYYTGASNVASRLFTPIATLLYRLRSAYVGLGKKKLWIDVGAGDGQFLKTVNAHQKVGVEISPSGRVLMKQAGLKTMTDKQFLRLKNLQADVISFWHVLEHMENPWDYLRAAQKHLTHSGTLIIGVPNVDCLEYRLFGQRWFHSPQFHLWQFTPRAIFLLLKQTGFTIKSIDYWSIEHHLPCLLQSCINATAGSDAVLHRFIKRGHTSGFTKKDLFWSLFWVTLGMPIVILLWVVGALTHKSGTVVIVARPRV
ncbi:hypothetical protein A2971_02475 [Candidatus Gottesmanbacteria bacterium RIFCSPLOWO2_01_FULL_46_21]|uniref:Methyltransferase type 12 n=1 Tax=Candidatus Gottesmanbacteria bacterium RIFCSPLOWO2_01_FULL_46_21 TaxID=1798393 RepID=A0A1F6AXY0_9BACT|nr:MAG: hypothetical protein A2971_02475 [Candidatus Gottesmanbacteria bacterium RIFCSPLOWO2_01_FULL_46_21]